jgi:predicted ATPase
LLVRDGRNLASVVRRMHAEAPQALERVKEFVRLVVPGIVDLEPVNLGHKIALEFRQQVQGSKDAWHFPAITMSDGTLRAVALLVALFQPGIRAGVPLVGIEEPETALHPAAAGVLFDALRSATRHTQVVVTTHSPELLDHPDLDPDEVRAVVAEAGTTTIGPLDEIRRGAMQDRLYTGGELLRSAGLEPAAPSGSVRIFENWATS